MQEGGYRSFYYKKEANIIDVKKNLPHPLFCSLKIPLLITERILVDKVNTVLFYLTLHGCFYAVAKHTQATFTY